MVLEEFLDQVGEAGFDDSAFLAIIDDNGNLVPVNCIDVEGCSDPFVRFFRDDDIPAFLGAPGSGVPVESVDMGVTVFDVEDIATRRARSPYGYPCRMSIHGDWSWHDVEIREFLSEDGYDVVVLGDAGEAHNPMF